MNQYKNIEIEYRKADSLIPYARNPRKNDEAAQKLAGVIAEFGFTVPVIIRSTGEIIDGHARLKAAQILKLDEVPVIVNDEWTEAQAKAFRLAVNKSAEWAEWDDELLQLELEELKLEDFDLELIGFDKLDVDNVDVEDDKYTQKITTPLYEPTGKDVSIADLYDDAKYKSLIASIDGNKDLSKKDKDFLKLAASRHIVFNYENIAEYYANATPEIQSFMEDSALVIIDYNKAVENGFVEVTKRVEELRDKEDDADDDA